MLRFSILPSVLFSILLLACWPVSENDLKRLTNFKISDRVHWFCRFFTIYSPFYDSRLNFGKGQGFLWKKMPQNVTLKFNLVLFLLEDWNDAAFEEDEIFQGQFSTFLPFLCEKCPFFEIPMFAWKSWSILLPRLRAFCARIWNWFKTVFPTSTVFKKMPWKWKCCFLYS